MAVITASFDNLSVDSGANGLVCVSTQTRRFSPPEKATFFLTVHDYSGIEGLQPSFHAYISELNGEQFNAGNAPRVVERNDITSITATLCVVNASASATLLGIYSDTDFF